MSGSCSKNLSKRLRSGLAGLGIAQSWGGVVQGGWHTSGRQGHLGWVKSEQQEVVHIWGLTAESSWLVQQFAVLINTGELQMCFNWEKCPSQRGGDLLELTMGELPVCPRDGCSDLLESSWQSCSESAQLRGAGGPGSWSPGDLTASFLSGVSCNTNIAVKSVLQEGKSCKEVA